MIRAVSLLREISGNLRLVGSSLLQERQKRGGNNNPATRGQRCTGYSILFLFIFLQPKKPVNLKNFTKSSCSSFFFFFCLDINRKSYLSDVVLKQTEVMQSTVWAVKPNDNRRYRHASGPSLIQNHPFKNWQICIGVRSLWH